jgi:hypothetical protein
MLDNVAAVALAKAKVLALITASLAAGGVGGAVALSHAAPSSHLVRDVAATSSVEDPETDEATDPETDEAQDPDTNEATDPETGDATDTETESASVKTAKAKDHGHGASSWSGNGHGKNNG